MQGLFMGFAGSSLMDTIKLHSEHYHTAITKMFRLFVVSVCALPFFITGCATISRGGTEALMIESDPSNASVTLSSGNVCTTPCVIEMKRTHDYHVKFEKTGYKTLDTDVIRQTSDSGAAGMAGNVLVGGLIGVGIDLATGATKSLRPNPLRVKLEPIMPQLAEQLAPQSAPQYLHASAPAMQESPTKPPSSPRVIGAAFGPSTMGLSVVQVDKNGVASRAGLRPGDLITQINGRDVSALYWQYAVSLITSSGPSVSVRLMGDQERILTFPK
jgi:hypothetical protein